jgi:hypothetical protein
MSYAFIAALDASFSFLACKMAASSLAFLAAAVLAF